MARSDQLAARRAFEVSGWELYTDRPDIGLQVFTAPAGAGGHLAKGFLGKAGKPSWFYRFRSDAELAEYVAQAIASREKSLEHKAKARAERAAAAPKIAVEVGDVFRCSWGYDQTNIDYYQVTRLVGKQSVEVREIGAVAWDEGWLRGRSVPAPDSFVGPPMVKRLQAYGDDVGIRIASYAYAYRMKPVVDGVPAYASSSWSAYH